MRSNYACREMLNEYKNCCITYFANTTEENYKAVVDAEHKCRAAKISYGEINRVRFEALNSVDAMSVTEQVPESGAANE